jgi:ABC-2 type transport system permease protein
MIPMLRRAFADLGVSTFWYSLGVVLYTALILSYYPALRDQAAAFDKLLASYPPALKAAFGISDFATYSGYIGVEILNVMWPLIVSVFAIMAGSAVVAAELERGTFEIWLSVPASRTVLLAAKLLGLALATAVIVTVTAATIGLGARAVSASVSGSGLVAMGANMLALMLVIAGVAALASSALSARGQAAGIAGGFALLSYLAHVLANLGDKWSWLKNVSVFTAYQPRRALEQGAVDPGRMAVLLAIIAVCAAGALLIFRRRDAIP